MSSDDKRKGLDRSAQKRPPRLRDIAELAEVDISVVSRTLNDDPNLTIAPETRQRILDVAAQLKYRPNAMARGLRQARTRMLGLLVPDVANFVYAELIHGVEEQAFEKGYVLVLANAQEYKKASEAYKRLVLEGRVDGLLIASAADGEVLPADYDAQTDAIVWANRQVEIGPSVIEDDEGGIALAVEHLAALGHRVIAHIAGPQDVDTGRRRREGFLKAMSALKLPVHEDHIAEGSFNEEGGVACMEKLLKTIPVPTAVVVSSLTVAIGALSVIKRNRLRVPDDLSLVAFHDAPIADYLDPPMTTIRMPLRELGRQAVSNLLELMNGDALPPTTVISTPPQFVKRGSTAPPRKE